MEGFQGHLVHFPHALVLVISLSLYISLSLSVSVSLLSPHFKSCFALFPSLSLSRFVFLSLHFNPVPLSSHSVSPTLSLSLFLFPSLSLSYPFFAWLGERGRTRLGVIPQRTLKSILICQYESHYQRGRLPVPHLKRGRGIAGRETETHTESKTREREANRVR